MEKQSQKQRLLELLLDFQPHKTPEIVEKVYGNSSLSLSRVGARINDLCKDYGLEFVDDRRFPNGSVMHGHKDKDNPKIYWYQLKRTPASLELLDKNKKTMTEVAILNYHPVQNSMFSTRQFISL